MELEAMEGTMLGLDPDYQERTREYFRICADAARMFRGFISQVSDASEEAGTVGKALARYHPLSTPALCRFAVVNPPGVLATFE